MEFALWRYETTKDKIALRCVYGSIINIYTWVLSRYTLRVRNINYIINTLTKIIVNMSSIINIKDDSNVEDRQVTHVLCSWRFIIFPLIKTTSFRLFQASFLVIASWTAVRIINHTKYVYSPINEKETLNETKLWLWWMVCYI